MSEVAAIILAAGQGVRFGAEPTTSKMLAILDGKPLIRWVAEAALASRCAEVLVVTGHAAEAVGAALQGLPLRLAHNPSFNTGMASSLRTGIAAIVPRRAGAIVLLGDMPLITAGIVDVLVDRFEDARLAGGSRPAAIVPARDGTWGNPVLLDRSVFAAIMTLEGDQGARSLLSTRDVLMLPMSSEAIMVDIDTLAGLATVAAKKSGQSPGISDGSAPIDRSASIASIASAEHGPEK